MGNNAVVLKLCLEMGITMETSQPLSSDSTHIRNLTSCLQCVPEWRCSKTKSMSSKSITYFKFLIKCSAPHSSWKSILSLEQASNPLHQYPLVHHRHVQDPPHQVHLRAHDLRPQPRALHPLRRLLRQRRHLDDAFPRPFTCRLPVPHRAPRSDRAELVSWVQTGVRRVGGKREGEDECGVAWGLVSNWYGGAEAQGPVDEG